MVVGQARYTRQARRRRRGAAPLAARSATLCSAQLAADPRPRLSIAPSPRAASPRCTFGAPLRGTPRQSRAGRCTRRPGGGRGESGRRCRAVRPPCASEPRVRRRRPHPPRESRPAPPSRVRQRLLVGSRRPRAPAAGAQRGGARRDRPPWRRSAPSLSWRPPPPPALSAPRVCRAAAHHPRALARPPPPRRRRPCRPPPPPPATRGGRAVCK
mmetsp:Transcript_18234/g.60114  ORF Transcript_18234/g.60114 Transcript_18234/m.60114 type:complete len:213 (+) Transcript_18234:248-886(+)